MLLDAYAADGMNLLEAGATTWCSPPSTLAEARRTFIPKVRTPESVDSGLSVVGLGSGAVDVEWAGGLWRQRSLM